MKIKICGLTKPEEAAYLNRCQVDFAGFVLFFPKSKRNNTIENARKIMKELSPSIKKTAVVVSPTAVQLQEIEEAGFDYIQIHGSIAKEAAEACRLPILKAFHVNDIAGFDSFRHWKQIAGYVFDAAEPGSGQTFDWNLIKKLPRDRKPLFLAGGLHPGNVAEAIAALSPDGVDVSSGVEYTDRPGKDEAKIIEFVRQVRSCSP